MDAPAQGRGIGRALTTALIDNAQEAGIEVLTLDLRGGNTTALHPYRSPDFREYDRLPDFVLDERRYDKVFFMLPSARLTALSRGRPARTRGDPEPGSGH